MPARRRSAQRKTTSTCRPASKCKTPQGLAHLRALGKTAHTLTAVHCRTPVRFSPAGPRPAGPWALGEPRPTAPTPSREPREWQYSLQAPQRGRAGPREDSVIQKAARKVGAASPGSALTVPPESPPDPGGSQRPGWRTVAVRRELTQGCRQKGSKRGREKESHVCTNRRLTIVKQ